KLAPDCKVGGIDFESSRHFSKIQLLSLDRVAQLAMIAADRALDNARLNLGETSRCGVFLGTGMGGTESLELAYWNFFKAEQKKRLLTVPMAMNHAPASQERHRS